MTKENIIKRLAEINQDLNGGDPSNPATLSANNINIFVSTFSDKEKNELLALIGEWSYKKRQKERKTLIIEQSKLEAELLTRLTDKENGRKN